jgi:hypothetical protein
MGLYQIENASHEFDLGVQIVSRPPDFLRPKSAYSNWSQAELGSQVSVKVGTPRLASSFSIACVSRFVVELPNRKAIRG